jgi:hypothetical protein
MFNDRYLARYIFASTYFLATPLGKKKDQSATMASKIPKPNKVDANNIQRPSFEQLSAEDRQAYEAYMKECEEENIRQKEKEDEEASRWFLSHFSIDRKGAISKEKEVVILSSEDEQAMLKANVSTAAPPVTLEQVSHLLVDGQEPMLATVQNMIDRSLGKCLYFLTITNKSANAWIYRCSISLGEYSDIVIYIFPKYGMV